MNPGPISRFGRFTAVTRAASLALLLACSATVAGDRTRVREQIQFSDPGTPVPSPTARPRAELPPKKFEFLDTANSISGVVAPFVAPSSSSFPKLPRNARLLEAMDQKRNWIYVQSEDLDRSPSVDEMFGVRDAKLTDQKSKTALENFIENRGQKPGRDRTREPSRDWNRPDPKKDFYSSFDRDGRPATNGNLRFGEHLDSSRTLSAGFSLPSDLLGISPADGRSDNLHNPGLGESVSTAANAKSSPDEFRKMLTVPGSLNPLVPGIGPLNLQGDTQRQEMNPAVAQRLVSPTVNGGDALDALRSLATPAVGRSSLLEGPTARALGPSSLSPAVTAPAAGPFSQPKPVILEFPQRKF